jgi:tetratricopeptide (TPR) repeat protein
LFEYAEGTSPIAAEIETHLSGCAECARELGEHRELVQVLASADTWDEATESAAAPRQFVIDVTAFAEKSKEEDARASQLCDEILTGPIAWWPTRLRKTRDAWTAGMVRQLLERTRAMLENTPAHALQISTMAIEIANELDVIAYPCDYVVKLRAQALRDHATVLSFMGRHLEALASAEQSQRLFAQVPLPEYDLARVAICRALILRNIDRIEEAITLTREAAATFLRFGDRGRYLNARVTEAAIVLERPDPRGALSIWLSVIDDPALESLTRSRVVHNVALCYSDLGEPEKALELLRRSIEEFAMLDMETERTRSRWNLGQTLVVAGRLKDAIPVLRQAWQEFEQMDMIADAGLVALELAEAMLLTGDASEVPAICRDIVTRFSRAGMTSRAITALSFLREAVALGQAKPSLVRHVYEFLRELPAERPRLFATLPAGNPARD